MSTLLVFFLLSYPWPLAPQNEQHSVSGTFGEYRSGPPPHFHDGTDIPGTGGTAVYAVASGEVLWLQETGYSSGVRVGRFAYVHVTPRADLSLGDYVSQGELVGYTNYANHVHFKDGGGASSYATRNALLPVDGLEPFEDNYHTGVLGIWYFRDNTSDQIPSNSLTGIVDVVVRAIDTTNLGATGQNNGVFSIGYALLTEDTSTLVIPPYIPFIFDTLPPSSALPYTYYEDWSNTSEYYYIVTNEFSGNSYIDFTTIPPGNYILAVIASDTRNPADTFYFPITVIPPDTISPQTPHLTSLLLDAENHLDLHWHPSPDTDLAGYSIFLKFEDSNWQKWGTAGATDSSFVTSAQAPGGWNFYMKILAYDGFWPPNESDTSEIFVLRRMDAAEKVLLINGGALYDRKDLFIPALDAMEGLDVRSGNESFAVSNITNYNAGFTMLGDSSWPQEFDQAVMNFMQNGGNFFVSGSCVLSSISQTPDGLSLLNDYFGVNYAGDTIYCDTVIGVSGTPFEGISFVLLDSVEVMDTVSAYPALLSTSGAIIGAFTDSSVIFSFKLAALSDSLITLLLNAARNAMQLTSVEESPERDIPLKRIYSQRRWLNYYSKYGGEVKIMLFDAAGRRRLERLYYAEKGWNRFGIEGLSPGIYFVIVDEGREKLFTKMVIFK
ncbi:MAG: hypothetical protein DRQ03_05355 [Candidatus Hydrothermota bacterium]|nr:MAG: hypothetical protein DRQ03_05355 [Candidatus Hydrothermae bacterium]